MRNRDQYQEEEKKNTKSMTREERKKELQTTRFQTLPPDDYRKLAIIPTIEEIKSKEKPFIRPIPEKGAFKDIRDLFDV